MSTIVPTELLEFERTWRPTPEHAQSTVPPKGPVALAALLDVESVTRHSEVFLERARVGRCSLLVTVPHELSVDGQRRVRRGAGSRIPQPDSVDRSCRLALDQHQKLMLSLVHPDRCASVKQ